ncbi:hypothetical protein D9756_008066 [Leucocoprinus leucothites]|uniref:F-box domain-containing protein n=1 Tax=Leucocoprinus leucothites TaxID=201217 RepID=A0A8H5D4A6_9AGAR|nr:hypothetical protein D9756_008066 [Leucoagaricus leucothites]
MEKHVHAASPATILPPKVLITICSLNAPPPAWYEFIQQIDEIVEDDDDTGDDSPQHERLDDDESIPPTSRSYIHDTINASHVCRTWRTILLSAPGLWCRMVDPYNPTMSKIMLERSQSLGIAFSLPAHKETDGRDEVDFEREMARQYVDRLTEYQFKCCFFLDLGPQSHYLRGSMNARHFPMLEDLSISFPIYSELPDKFPGAGMPKLKRLHLHRCFFKDGSQFSAVDNTLVRLHIDHNSLTEDGLVNALRALPRLQVLILNRAFDRAAQAPVELRSDNFLCLSHLRELRITDAHSSRAASFLRRIMTTQTLSIFCLELDFPRSKWYEATDAVANARLFQQLSWILSGMSAVKPLSTLKVACRRGVTFCDDPSTMLGDAALAGKAHLTPTPERCFHVQFIPSYPFKHSDYLLGLILFLVGSKKTFVSEFHSTIGNLGAYSQINRLVIPDYREDVNERIAVQILRQCRDVRVLEEVTLCLWELLYEIDTTSGLEEPILSNLEELSFDALDVTFKRRSGRNLDELESANLLDEEMTGALWLARPASSEDDKSYVEEDDPDYQYESGHSDWEDEPDTFVEDLVEFCKKRKSLRIVRFSEVEDDVLAECKEQLGSLGVDVELDL